MDQLKQYLSVAQKYHFWILSGVVTVAFLAVWVLSTSKMSSETTSRRSTIESSYSAGNSITQIVNHPNPQSAEMMKRLIDGEATQVAKAWELRYREQEDVLKWPEELLPDFIQQVENLKPIELTVKFPTPSSDELAPNLRGRYRDYIKDELPKLANIIGASWQVDRSASSGMYGGSGSGMEDGPLGGPGTSGGMGMGGSGIPGGGEGYGFGSGEDEGGYAGPVGQRDDGKPIVVDWNTGNQSTLQATRFTWGTNPTTLQVLYAQEDLWVLRALMLIVKATNGDADAQYNAAIKEIQSIDLGASAAGIKLVGRVKSATSGAASGDMYGGMGYGGDASEGSEAAAGSGDFGSGGYGAGEGEGEGASFYGSGSGLGSGASQSTSLDPAEGRYVDDKNEPLTASRLRAAMTSAEPADAFLAVAKRMPVRLRLKMNVLKLPLFLSECANSDLPVEVRQVRINAAAGASAGSGFGGSEGSGAPGVMGAGGSGMGMSPGAGGMSGGGEMGMGGGEEGLGSMGDMGSMGYGGAAAANYESPYDATVEIYGIIYIYNPVDPKKLGLDEEGANTGIAPGGSPAGGAPAAASAPTSGVPAAGGDGAAAPSSGPAAAAGGSAPPAGAAAGTGTSGPAGAGAPAASGAPAAGSGGSGTPATPAGAASNGG